MLVSKEVINFAIDNQDFPVMIRQSEIARVIDDQKSQLRPRPDEIEREQLSQVKNLDGFATIITGMRRVGKSTLLNQVARNMGYGHVMYLNFDDINMSGFEQDDFVRLHNEIKRREAHELFFDEIQLVAGWEILIHQLLREGYVVYISGSNASMLSVDLGTHLTGRHLSTELFPFSYNEFLTYAREAASVQSLDNYMLTGGIPEFVKTRDRAILRTLLDDVLVRDIAVNKNVRNVDALKQLAVYMLSNIARLYSASKLTTVAGVSSPSTVIDFLSFMRNAYLIDSIGLYDHSLKVTARNPRKAYACDTGLARSVSLSHSPDMGRYLENVVFISLRHRYTSDHIYYYAQRGECDFVVTGADNRPEMLIQVCHELNDENFEREMNGLTEAMASLHLNYGVIVTRDEEDHFETAAGGVDVVKAWKWLACSPHAPILID